jgi:hypothetical protein
MYFTRVHEDIHLATLLDKKTFRMWLDKQPPERMLGSRDPPINVIQHYLSDNGVDVPVGLYSLLIGGRRVGLPPWAYTTVLHAAKRAGGVLTAEELRRLFQQLRL